MIFAWPFDIDIVDSTGAGDAFGAGLVATIVKHDELSFGTFLEAVKNARNWAAYACGSRGGASELPDLIRLNQHSEKIAPLQMEAVQIKNYSEAVLFLKLVDKAYPMSNYTMP